MTLEKVVIITGASRGIGLAIANYLLKASHKVVVVARTPEPLEELKRQYPGQVEILIADLSDFSAGERVTALALKTFSRIDGLVINHGTLGNVKHIAESTSAEWQSVFDTNFFSAVSFVRVAIPSLRNTRGRVVFVSSGAAIGAYSTWGAYGASKAALNHLALTLAAEESLITSVAIRPGAVDTAMQKIIRDEYSEKMDEKDSTKFRDLYNSGKLLKPEQPGHVIARLVLNAPKDLNGKFLSWDDKSLVHFMSIEGATEL